MKNRLQFCLFLGLVTALVGSVDSFAATKSTKQSAIQMGTKVRTRTEAKGIYDQECYDAYYGCMDQFCISDNENGGTCTCSDEAAKYESQLEDIRKTLAEAERINTEEVEKVQAGANADIIFNGGERVYNKDGSVVKAGETKKDNKVNFTSIFDQQDEDEDLWADGDLSDKSGAELYDAANKLCKEQMPDSCSKDMKILTQMYSRQIVSDCKGFANSVAQKKQEADTALNQARAAVRGALKESLAESNQYTRGECMVEYKKCMMGADACGADWSNCVFTIASENMQNNKAKSVVKSRVKKVEKYEITPSTMEILESKRYICERVLNKCVANSQYVWDDFLREAAPTIHLAELNVESNKRQSCLTDISNCIQKACKDDIAGKGTATMDACLSRPAMARSFCKIQIDPCERMEPQIWDYVTAKLAAMRVDACTNEVKECFTSEDRCGPNFMNCIGMDFDYIHDICPIDKLVVCKQANPDFKMSDLDDMLMGLYLNIDNKALDNCQKLAEQKMVELCGSTTDCNLFAADDTLGSGSIKSQKDGSIYRVTGMISFGSIKMGDALKKITDGTKTLEPGQIGVEEYIQHVKKLNTGIPNKNAIVENIQEELNNIAGTINRTISLLESDQQIRYCVYGRDLSQINGRDKSDENKTNARFPNLLAQYKTMIGLSALRKAQDNYNKKLNEEIANATKDASADVAQYMCQMLPSGDDGSLSSGGDSLTAPYAISYDVGLGVNRSNLAKTGKQTDDITANGTVSGKREITSVFNRETRICHVCTTTNIENCEKLKVKNGVKVKKKNCTTDVQTSCEDIQM